MRKLWTLTIDGHPVEVDVTWDVTLTGAGRIVVDGRLVDAWNIGVKWPGTSRAFLVAGRAARVTQGWFDFDLDVDGVAAPPARRAPGGLPRAAFAPTALLVAVFLLLGIGVAVAIALAPG